MARRVYNLNAQDTEKFLNVMRKLRSNDEDRLVEAQIKREAENPEKYGH